MIIRPRRSVALRQALYRRVNHDTAGPGRETRLVLGGRAGSIYVGTQSVLRTRAPRDDTDPFAG
jgi:hypothetical protein